MPRMKKVLFPVTHKYVIRPPKEIWIENYQGNINERMNTGLGAWYGDSPYAVARKVNGAVINFKAKLAYTDLQRYDEIAMDDGVIQEDWSRRLQECIRFWAKSAVWSTYTEKTQLEAPYWCGPTYTYKDSSGRIDKWMGSNIQMYDISPVGYAWEFDTNKWGAGTHTDTGWKWFPAADEMDIQHLYAPRTLTNIDITFNVKPASYYINQFLNTSCDYTYHEEYFGKEWSDGGYVPCVEFGIDFNIQRGYAYENLGNGWSWKAKDTVIWLYALETFIDGIPADEYHDAGFTFHDGYLAYIPSGTINNSLYGLGNDSRGSKIIGNQYKYAPWERYPNL